MKPLFHSAILFALLLFPAISFSQAPAKWSVNGNAIANGDFLGTTNNQPLIFYTNNVEVMRLKPTGELKLNNLGGFGDGLVTVNNNGVFGMTSFTGDTTKVFTGAGVYRSIYSISGWKRVGNNVVNNNGAFIGIGTNNPQYILDVDGTVRFNGIVNANGINIVNKLQADTIKGMSMIDVNGNMELSGGAINEVYTKTGDMRFQSRSGFNGNTIFNAGTNGNVGIGIFSPMYKLDVYGDERVNGMIRTKRISCLSGDTVVIVGDSTIYFSATSNKIYHSTTNSVYKGMSIGTATSSGHGLNSLALGTSVWTTSNAVNSIVMGAGAQSSLRNDIPNSLMVGFNSDIPTLFVGASTGNNTVGKVGIGTTGPQSEVQFGEGIRRLNFGSNMSSSSGILSYMGFNAEINSSSYMHTTGDGIINTGGIISLGSDGSIRFNVMPNVSGGNDLLQDPLHFAAGSQMRIYNSHIEIGQGSISSTSPYYNDLQTKLMVAGRIMCQDVVVSLVDWQDEVFDTTYNLIPLDSVNAFIHANKHLPGIPEEHKIETEGMSVAQTAQMQQAKIEEMMLYILQLNERMKALEEENAKLKAAGGK